MKKLRRGQQIDLQEIIKENSSYNSSNVSDKELLKIAEEKMKIPLTLPMIVHYRSKKLKIKGKKKKEQSKEQNSNETKVWKGGNNIDFTKLFKRLEKQQKLTNKYLSTLVDRFTKRARIISTTTENPK